jgi:hypothetical protein
LTLEHKSVIFIINMSPETHKQESPLDKTNQSAFIVPREDEYDQLGKSLQEGSWSRQRSLENYVTATDGIIGILDGSISNKERDDAVYISKNTPGKFHLEKRKTSEIEGLSTPDVVLWLDKSARPVSWLVSELWDQLATPDENGNLPKKPKSVFLNIDRKPWVSKAGIDWRKNDPMSVTNLDVNELGTDGNSAQDEIGRIRLLFVEDSRANEDGQKIKLTKENWKDEVWKMPLKAKPDGTPYKHMLVVDEVKYSGDTLDISQRLIAAALPELAVSGAHWYKPHRSEWNPAWYSPKHETGRGVGDIGNGWYTSPSNDNNFKHKLASAVLSPPLMDRDTGERKPDVRANKLRKDIGKLAHQLAQKKLLYRPSTARSNQEMINRAKKINGVDMSTYRKIVYSPERK